MKEKIKQINQSIAIKRDRLKDQATRSFESITLPTAPAVSHGTSVSSVTKTPGLTYVLYAITVALVIIGICSEGSTLLMFILAVFSAIGGFLFAKRQTTTSVAVPSTLSADLNSIKSNVISQGIDSVKGITQDWDEFMEKKQKEMYDAIDSSNLSESQKDGLSSRIFSYEVIDINLSDLMTKINSATSVSEIQQRLDSYKTQLMNAIDIAAEKQMNKYNSLVNAI